MRILQVLPMYHPVGEKYLQQHAEVIKTDNYDPAHLKKLIKDVDGVLVRAPARLTEEILESAEQVKAVSGAGVGLDNIDVEFASKKGIKVLHAPKVNTVATAEHAVTLILSVAKKITYFHGEMKIGNFDSRNDHYTQEVYGKQLGLVGWGDIAQQVAHICSYGLNMKICAYVRSVNKEKVEAAAKYNVELTTDLNNLLETSDYVSVHLPHTKETEALINKEKLERMKKTSYLVNTGRGGVVDEKALYSALKENKIAGAAVDVFRKEPPGDNHPFYSLNNILMTPHVGGISEEAAKSSSELVAKNLVGAINGKEVPNSAN
ncbi:hydroxyacid dehydrogenase [Alkalicoccus saliphilus]|nr:hydroxyacid dehydrogenase [Alkalicoccus saliphilus]